ncbi:hypothetical protein ACQYAD_08480 [Neobacillus sp. SM06]|uniref:hypothetical protein n=1 Tax=Neobacillus sp. SM06 TaxID=3422492 RepID=UPI003D2CF500
MKKIDLLDEEIEILIDALRTQARRGHLPESFQTKASKLLLSLCALLNQKGK